MNELPPSFRIELIDKIIKAIREKYGNDIDKIARYVGFATGCTFDYRIPIFQPEYVWPCAQKALDMVDNEHLFKTAVDLGIEVPGLTYTVVEIKNFLSERYEDIGIAFEGACKKIYSEPATAIIEANSALERIKRNSQKRRFCGL
ncbi:MAG: hypothetical protein LBM19_01365 [Holosporales bacterium]|jgi:hypothetical protein|nr:hypothetical protein [Holosporales bacterium]